MQSIVVDTDYVGEFLGDSLVDSTDSLSKSDDVASNKDLCSILIDNTEESVGEPVPTVEHENQLPDTSLRIPGKWVNFVDINNPLMNVEISINDKIVNALVDTGAAVSLISDKLVAELGLTYVPLTGDMNVIGHNTINTIGSIKLPVWIKGIPMVASDFLVVSSDLQITSSCVLGVSFMRSNNVKICPHKRTLVKHIEDKGEIEIHLNENGKPVRVLYCNMRCYANKDIKLEPNRVTSVSVSFAVPFASPDHLLMYSDDDIDSKFKDKVAGISGVTNSSNKVILLSSSSDAPIHVKKGNILGSIFSVVEIPSLDEVPSDLLSDDEFKSILKLPELSNEEKNKVLSEMKQFRSVFSKGDTDLGLANVTKHVINLSDKTPICQKSRRFPRPLAEEIEKQCEELNSLDIIESSISPWSAPIVPIRKKDGALRMCIDYRQLNKVTVPDKFPVPNLLDSLFGLSGTEYFTSLDLVRGYYQIPIDENSKEYTAFSSPKNHWQFKRLSFGLRNAPAAFQREIQAVLHSFPSNKVVAYLDDILIMGNNFEEHLQLVVKVLQTLEKYNIKIKPSKCDWFRSRVEYLGHIVSRSGIRKTDDYLRKVEEFPRPKTVGELREFLGLVNFQRKFIPNCSEIQKPLSCLTGGRKRKLLVWTPDMVEAFKQLKLDMQRDMELAYPIYDDDASKIELWVDASNYGAGAYLAQMQGESHRVIGFASMTFTPTQLNYSTLERELTALRWGVKTFRPFLYGVQFILYTDHQPLVYLNNMKLVCSRLARTVDELSDFVFEIRYVPGRLNDAADALSRIGSVPLPETQTCSPSLPKGLMICGEKAEGGGDSMLVSLLRTLSSVVDSRNLPGNHVELRALLVDELLNNSTKYNLNLDKYSRKTLKLMRCPGQLPSVDIFLAVSKLFKVKVFVYYWSEQPIIYQYDHYTPTIHLQNVSGIHYNPLVEIVNYEPPEVTECTVNTVSKSPQVLIQDNSGCGGDTDDDEFHELCNRLFDLTSDTSISYCSHGQDALPGIMVAIDNDRFCAILDTGAEISLVSRSVIEKLGLQVSQERLCNVVGYSGEVVPITETAEINFKFGNFQPDKAHKFAVVDECIFPKCFLVGLDYLADNSIDIDFSENACYRNGDTICEMIHNEIHNDSPNVFNLRSVASAEIRKLSSGDLRIQIEGNKDTITGLSILMDNDSVRILQAKCPELKLVLKNIRNKVPGAKWPGRIKSFARHARKLSINHGLLTYCGPKPIIVVPFSSMVELVISVHFGMAHIGRDKIIDLLYDLVWHPNKYKTVSDVCKTCHKCQILKEFSSVTLPPTLKIQSSYPFELMAADCISLPTTSKGYIGCLVAVDHYSKWLTVIPIKNKKSSSIVEAFQKHIFPYILRLPTSILSDNGPEFKSAEFADFLSEMGINHKLTTPNCPTSNGAVERVNRTVKNLLKSLLDEGFNWDTHLPRALITYNQTLHSELNMSPSRFLLSQSHNSDNRLPILGKISEKWRMGHPNYVPFSVGQNVLMKVEHRGFLTTNKLSANFKGPYKITGVDPNRLTYEVTNLETDWVGKTHHSKLRIYRKPPMYLSNNPLYNEMCGVEVADEDVSLPIFEYSFDENNSYSSDDESSLTSVDVCTSDDGSFLGFSNSSAQSVMSTNIASSSESKFPQSSKVSICRGCHFEKELEVNASNNTEIEAPLHVLGGGEGDGLSGSRAVVLETSGLSSEVMQYDMYRLTFPEDNAEVQSIDLPIDHESYNCFGNREDNISAIDAGDVNHVPNQARFSLADSLQIVPEVNSDDNFGNNNNDCVNSYTYNRAFNCGIHVNLDNVNGVVAEDVYGEIGLASTLDWQVSPLEDSDEEFQNSYNSHVSSFDGFDERDANENNFERLNRLFRSAPDSEHVSNNYSADSEYIRHTRSKGPVDDYPNVQPKTLERKN